MIATMGRREYNGPVLYIPLEIKNERKRHQCD